MTEAKRNLAVGVTVLAGLVSLAVLLILFGYLPAALNPRYAVTIDVPDAAGLTQGAAVGYRGINVGEIRSIRLRTDPRHRGVEIVAMLREDVALPAELHAEIVTAAFLGGSRLVLAEDDTLSGDPLPRDGSARLRGRVLSPLDAMGGDLAKAITGPIQRIGGIIDRYDALAVEWREVAVNLRAITDARTPDQVDAGDGPATLASILARADSRIAELKQAIAGINRYVDDDQLRNDVKATVANAREMSTAGKASMARVDDAVAEITTSVQALEKRYVAAADDLSAAVGDARKLINQAREGDGTAGKLIQDPALYDNLTDAAQRMNLVLQRLELLFDKWRDEGVELSF
jgi:phospholipid/cholesterol/gamma-HCH transport system substrate-binding protein